MELKTIQDHIKKQKELIEEAQKTLEWWEAIETLKQCETSCLYKVNGKPVRAFFKDELTDAVCLSRHDNYTYLIISLDTIKSRSDSRKLPAWANIVLGAAKVIDEYNK